MPELAQGLIDQNVDLIVAITNVAATGAKVATEKAGRTDIPIVFAHANKPDATGLINSFKSSGNNLTGVAIDFTEVTAKKLEFLRQIDPSIKRVGAFDLVHQNTGGKSVFSELKKVAPTFGMDLVLYKVENEPGPKATAEISGIAAKVKPGDIDAYFHIPGPSDAVTLDNIRLVIEMTNRLQIPAVYNLGTQVEIGGLFSYAYDLPLMGKQTAVFADKVLKGQSPIDIPVEFPNKNSLVINAKTAKEIGLTIPESLLLIANRIIQ